MQSQSDAQLLREFAEHGTEAAFTEIVTRHTNLVYSAALRQLDSPDLAGEVAQTVFIALARGAQGLSRKLAENASLAGWLCRSARNLSLNLRRDEFRRYAREKQAMEQLDSMSGSSVDWSLLRPALDAAMSELSEPDYDALVLRYYKNQNLRAVGLALGVSDDTAQKRVARALDKLSGLLSQRGIMNSAASLSVVLSAHAVHSAPLGMAAAISVAALPAATTVITTATIKTVAMTTLQKTLIGTSLVAAIGTGIYENRQATRWREETLTLRQRESVLAKQVEQIGNERDEARERLTATQPKTADAPDRPNELMKLRAQVARLQASERELAQLKAATGNDPAIEATLKSWAARATQLKQRLGQMPDKSIPELRLVTDKDWFDAIKNAKALESDTDVREALHNLRNGAKHAFGNMTLEALKKYAEANDGLLPTEMSQLKPYYDTPVDDAMLARYALLQSGKLADVGAAEFLFGEKAPPVDEEYDSRYKFGMNGTQSSSVNNLGDLVWNGLMEFAKGHNGLITVDASQLEPYLPRPLDPAKVQNILGSLPPGITTMEQLKAAGPK